MLEFCLSYENKDVVGSGSGGESPLLKSRWGPKSCDGSKPFLPVIKIVHDCGISKGFNLR